MRSFDVQVIRSNGDDFWTSSVGTAKPVAHKSIGSRTNFGSWEASSDEDIRQASRTEEALIESDASRGDFAETRIEVDNYRQKVKDKYPALSLPDATKITDMIEKFKGKCPNIALE